MRIFIKCVLDTLVMYCIFKNSLKSRTWSSWKDKELLVSPNEMHSKFIRLINDKIKNKKAEKPAYIKMKVNHVTDPIMVNKLYEASQAGVDIQLVRISLSIVKQQQ